MRRKRPCVNEWRVAYWPLGDVRRFCHGQRGTADPAGVLFGRQHCSGPCFSPPGLDAKFCTGDEGLAGCSADWLHGCSTANSLDEALAQRAQLGDGQVIFYRLLRHAVTAHSVSFYAKDSEQSGLLAGAQEREQLDKALRAQAAAGKKMPKPRWPWADHAYRAGQRWAGSAPAAKPLAGPAGRT